MSGTFNVRLPEDNVSQGRRLVRIKASMAGNVSTISPLVLLDSINDGWHNSSDMYDVDGDGGLSPLDALMLVNEINRDGVRRLDSNSELDQQLAFVDVNEDGRLDPLDVLAIVNEINRRR